MKTLRIAGLIAVSLASHAIAYVGAGSMEPIPALTLEELSVSREDHELAKQWTEARRGHYENEITRFPRASRQWPALNILETKPIVL